MLAERVAKRFAALNHEAKADPLWNQWLDEAHGGGKAKVPNPNPSTRGRYREVSFSTALKDDAFKVHALKQFEAWKERHKDDPKPEKKPKAPAKPRKKLTRAEALDGGEAVFHHVSREKVHTKVHEIIEGAKKARDAYLEREGIDPWFADHVRKMSDADVFLHFGAGKVGDYFQNEFLKKGHEEWTHKDLVNGWTGSATSDESRTMCAAVEDLGFSGSLAPDDDPEEFENARRMAKGNDLLHTWMQKVHTFQQEVFKALEVKEVTLYRGVKEGIRSNEDRLDRSIKVGDRVSIETRALSSFTSDPRVAARFGEYGGVIEYKVPAENVLLSPLVAPHLGSAAHDSSSFGEAEFVVMGAEELEGKMTDIRKQMHNTKWASEEKVKKIPISTENEDWIRTLRKQRQMAEKIARAFTMNPLSLHILHRFAQEQPRIIGRAKLEDDTTSCEHCGREIKNLVYLNNGRTVGEQCALRFLGYTRSQVQQAPIAQSWATLKQYLYKTGLLPGVRLVLVDHDLCEVHRTGAAVSRVIVKGPHGIVDDITIDLRARRDPLKGQPVIITERDKDPVTVYQR